MAGTPSRIRRDTGEAGRTVAFRRTRPALKALLALRYLWAAPASGIGLIAAGAWLLFGARGRFAQGALEVSGGRLAIMVARFPAPWRFSAITFGHVILGLSADVLERVRAHEQAHVRQYERWGALFFPLYAGASLVAWLNAGHPYWHNHFEREARRVAGEDEPPALRARHTRTS